MVDQYLSFIAPSSSLYSLMPPPVPAPESPNQAGPSTPPSSYSILNSPSSAEQQIEAEIERIASGLFSVVATAGMFLPKPLGQPLPTLYVGQVPVIRAPRGNAAEMVAKKLETRIRDSIITASRSQGSSLFTQDATGIANLSRPRKYFCHIPIFSLIHPVPSAPHPGPQY